MDLIAPLRVLELSGLGEAVIVDIRGPSEFARGYPPGAINLSYSAKGLLTRLELVLTAGTSVVVVGEEADKVNGALLQLKEGPFPVLGFVVDIESTWIREGYEMETLSEISVRELSEIASDPDITVLDVREPIEWESGHVPGATLISLGHIRQRLDEIPRGFRVAVICEAGIRSSTVASMLQRAGFPQVLNVFDGSSAYRKAGFRLQFPK